MLSSGKWKEGSGDKGTLPKVLEDAREGQVILLQEMVIAVRQAQSFHQIKCRRRFDKDSRSTGASSFVVNLCRIHATSGVRSLRNGVARSSAKKHGEHSRATLGGVPCGYRTFFQYR